MKKKRNIRIKLSKVMEETTEQRLKRFEKAYNILMDYFDYLPDDLRIKAHERLNKENL